MFGKLGASGGFGSLGSGGARKSAGIPNATFNFIAEGDSITVGLGGTPSYPFVALAAMPGASLTTVTPNITATSPLAGGGNITLNDIATSGISTITLDQNFSTRANAVIQATGQTNILSYMAGTNSSGATDANLIQRYAWIRDYLRRFKNAAPAGSRIVIGTVPYRNDGGTDPTDLNANIRTLYNSDLQADALMDFGNDSRFSPASAADNLTYYNSDKLHPNVAGEAAMGSIMTPGLLSVLQGAGAQIFATPTWSPFGTNFTPGDSTSITLSNGNRTATTPGGVAKYGIRGLPGARSGKLYWEVDITRSNTVLVGLVNDSFAFNTTTFIGQDAGTNSFMWGNDGTTQINNISHGTIGTYVNGDNLGLAFDFDAKLFWGRTTHSGVPGNWNNSGAAVPYVSGGISFSAMTALGRGDRYYPAASVNAGTDAVLSRFRSSELVNAIPSGGSTFG